MERSKGMSGESFRAMIVFVRSMMTSVGTRSGGGSRASQPSSNASLRSASNRPAGFETAPRPRRAAPRLRGPPPGYSGWRASRAPASADSISPGSPEVRTSCPPLIAVR